jgi:hypothetical protein
MSFAHCPTSPTLEHSAEKATAVVARYVDLAGAQRQNHCKQSLTISRR